MTRRLPIALAACALFALPSTALAGQAPLHPDFTAAKAKKKPKKPATKAPVVTKVSPRNAKVGDTLTITGKNFVPGKGKNQVFFYTTKGGGTFTKAADASKTRIKVVVPAKLASLLPANGDEARILLRVKGKRLGARSSAKVSPLIAINPDDVGGDTSGTGSATGPAACTPDFNNPLSDVDKDLLSDADERKFMLDACLRDTDGDGASDGYEYQSAVDLNSQYRSSALPYPFRTPYPNPLFKDANVDYDGDGLYLIDEYSLWAKYGQDHGRALVPLTLKYSDGKQVSDPSAGTSDDYRDADEDGLGNWDESHGHMTPGWWKGFYDGADTARPLETPYPVTFGPVSMLEWDSDGDDVRDGDDDSDFDGLSNSFEVHRPSGWQTTYVAIGNVTQNWNASTGKADTDTTTPAVDYGYRYYSRVQPFNPCKPVRSKNCHIHYPFGYYPPDEKWEGPTVPADATPGEF